MGLIKEPKNIDFSVQSEPWTAEELIAFRKHMAEIRKKEKRRKTTNAKKASGKGNAA